MRQRVFVDTWGWLALANVRDPHHLEVSRCFRALRARGEQLVTTD